MPSAGFLIYSGVIPLLKTFIAIIVGFAAAKTGNFPPNAARGVSYVTMNVSLPALIFASVVPAFTSQNISAIGPLLLAAFVYQAIGLVFGLIIRELCYVPRNFWQGIVVMCALSNWGNLPTAVVLSVAQQSPFNPSTDPALGISFIAIFIVAYNLIFFVLGAAQSLAWDYLPGVPQGLDAEARVSWKQKPIGSMISRYILHDPVPRTSQWTTGKTQEELGDVENVSEKGSSEKREKSTLPYQSPDPSCSHRVSAASIASHSAPLSRQPSIHSQDLDATATSTAVIDPLPHVTDPIPLPLPRHRHPAFIRTKSLLGSLCTPITIVLAISLPIALIQPLKALFVDVTSFGGPNFKGPDGRPPLAFLIDTAQFIGNITVPMALIQLGASFARLTIPRPLSRLPVMAMMSVTVAKMIILPIAGVFIVEAMVHSGLIRSSAKMEKFVAIFLSGSPAAVNQLIATCLYAPDGNVDTLSAFLLVQYVFMFFTLSALTAVALLLS